MTERFFLTVEWCNNGKRGVFCKDDGSAFSQDKAFTENEARNILGAFDLILSPQSQALTEEELKQFSRFVPLAEYSNYYGIALKETDIKEAPCPKKKA